MTYLTIFLHAAFTLGTLILLSRMQGLRTFAKMSGFDFAVTVSFGSILGASVMSPETSVVVPLTALVSLFVIQIILAQARVRLEKFDDILENTPLLVMRNGEILERNLAKADMTKSDLWAKLREANVFDLETIAAVVVERSGEVSVLHGANASTATISPELLKDVRC